MGEKKGAEDGAPWAGTQCRDAVRAPCLLDCKTCKKPPGKTTLKATKLGITPHNLSHPLGESCEVDGWAPVNPGPLSGSVLLNERRRPTATALPQFPHLQRRHSPYTGRRASLV